MLKYSCYGCKHLPHDEICKRCGNYILSPDGEGTVFIKDKWESKKVTISVSAGKEGQTMRYRANGFDYKFEKLEDDWRGIYEWNSYTSKCNRLIQVKGLERAKSWCGLREPCPWFVRKLV